jgi:dihydrodipicolinate synthase/N-acetylneuraminate lyase
MFRIAFKATNLEFLLAGWNAYIAKEVITTADAAARSGFADILVTPPP